MRKLFLLLALLMGCGSQPSVKALPPPLPIVDSTVQTVHDEDWSITLPTEYKAARVPSLIPAGISIKSFADSTRGRLVFILRQEDTSSRKSKEEYVSRFTSLLTAQGGMVIGDPKDFQIDGQPFSLIVVIKDAVEMILFIHLDNGVAHTIMCGGRTMDTQLGTDCGNIAHTFKISSTKSRSFVEKKHDGASQDWLVKLVFDTLNQN